jgi:hypothetical protein
MREVLSDTLAEVEAAAGGAADAPIAEVFGLPVPHPEARTAHAIAHDLNMIRS